MRPRSLLAASVLVLAACVPASADTQPPATSPPAPVYRGPTAQPVNYAAIAAAKAEADLVAFYAWASKLPPPTKIVKSVNLPTAAVEYDSGSIETLILDTFGAAGPKALAVARCESGLNPAARNGQYVGIFQLGNYHQARAERLGYTWGQMVEAGPNIAVAYDLWLEQGWGPWSCA